MEGMVGVINEKETIVTDFETAAGMFSISISIALDFEFSILT